MEMATMRATMKNENKGDGGSGGSSLVAAWWWWWC
jgi:hypothetical protein